MFNKKVLQVLAYILGVLIILMALFAVFSPLFYQSMMSSDMGQTVLGTYSAVSALTVMGGAYLVVGAIQNYLARLKK